jgi:hypothetical protein
MSEEFTLQELTPNLAVPRLRLLVAGLQPRRPGFAPRSVYVAVMVDKEPLRYVFLRVLWISPVIVVLHTNVTQGINNSPVGDRSSETQSRPIDMNNNNKNSGFQQARMRKMFFPLKVAYYVFPTCYELGERRWNYILTEENRRTRRKAYPSPLCPWQIPHGLTRARTRASAVRGRRLSTWAMTRPCEICYNWRRIMVKKVKQSR